MFDRSEVPDKSAMIALWYHKTDITQKMRATMGYLYQSQARQRKAGGGFMGEARTINVSQSRSLEYGKMH